jgi:hypothetical protein
MDERVASLWDRRVNSPPITDTIDVATLRLYETSSSNANGLTLAAYGVQAEWTDSQANRAQRQTGANWQVAVMGSGSDYAAGAAGTVPLASAGGVFLDLDVTALAQAWVADPVANHGLVLLRDLVVFQDRRTLTV